MEWATASSSLTSKSFSPLKKNLNPLFLDCHIVRGNVYIDCVQHSSSTVHTVHSAILVILITVHYNTFLFKNLRPLIRNLSIHRSIIVVCCKWQWVTKCDWLVGLHRSFNWLQPIPNFSSPFKNTSMPFRVIYASKEASLAQKASTGHQHFGDSFHRQMLG